MKKEKILQNAYLCVEGYRNQKKRKVLKSRILNTKLKTMNGAGKKGGDNLDKEK